MQQTTDYYLYQEYLCVTCISWSTANLRKLVYSYAIGAVILSPAMLGKKIYVCNPIIHNTIRIWKQIGMHFSLRKVSFLLPIASNPSFAPLNLDGFFSGWKELGIGNIGDLLIGLTFASFEQLRERYDLPWTHRFRYFQIRN